ncbi:MAG: DUF374 domain-containing protein [Planctomycetota bacterium]|nr:MAG: DUF374 domain-containing protein [Planctomycetota bacterium]
MKKKTKKKKWYKKFLKALEKKGLPLLVDLGSLLLRILMSTMSVRWYGLENLEKVHRHYPSAIYGFWHQRMLAFIMTHKGYGVHVMISSHRDGEIITQIIRRFGFDAVRGSTYRQGAKALKEMMEILQQGKDIAITPDGPRGPKYTLQKGIIHLAKATGLPIVLGSYGASACWKARSWDSFMVPKPFSRIAIVVSQPILIPSDISKEEFEKWRQKVEKMLREITAKADELAVHPQPRFSQRGFRYYRPPYFPGN